MDAEARTDPIADPALELDLQIAHVLVERGHLEAEVASRITVRTVDIIGEVLERLSTGDRMESALEDLLQADLPISIADRLRKWVRRSEEFTARTLLVGPRPADERGHATIIIPRPTGAEVPPVDPELAPTRRHLPEVRLPEWYEVRRLLGRGGMGAVYEAYDRDLNRIVAIKVMNEADPEAVRRFVAELRATARLAHPNILPVYTADADEFGRPYYVMKKVEGRNLWQAKKEGLPLRDLVRAVAAAARGVAHAHREGFLHRDIKPDNIMVGEQGEVWVVDWGLVHADPALSSISISDAPLSRLTMTGYMMGTLGYAAPEQVSGDPSRVGEAADVHGLGATLYEVLTGRRPYDGSSAHEVLKNIFEGRPARPGVESPPELSSVAMRALGKDPLQRHPTAAALAEDLEAWLGGRPVPSHGYPVLDRIGLWIRNHPVATIAASLAFLAIFALVLIRINRLRIESENARNLRQSRVAELKRRADAALDTIRPALVEAGAAQQRRLAALERYGEPYRRIWEDSYDADRVLKEKGPPYVEGDPAVASADRDWRIAAATISNQLTIIDAITEQAGEPDLDAIEELGLLHLEDYRTKIVVQEAEWSLERARFLEDATIDTRSLEGLRKTALLDSGVTGLSPLYVEVLSVWERLPAVHPYRAEVAELLAARGSLRIGSRPGHTRARLIEFITTENPFGRKIIDASVPSEGRTYDLPIGSYALEVESGDRPEDLVVFPRLVERRRTVEIEVALPERVPEGFVYVTPGIWIAGGTGYGAWERHRACTVRGYFVGRCEISLEAYREYLGWLVATEDFRLGRRVPLRRNAKDARPMEVLGDDLRILDAEVDRDTDPVRGVSCVAARSYAEWVSEASRLARARLPREWEWEYCARGADGRMYPWGDASAPGLANLESGNGAMRVHASGTFPMDRTVFGALDMAGNVNEWTDSSSGGGVYLRGGNSGIRPEIATLDLRKLLDASYWSELVGFRLAIDQ